MFLVVNFVGVSFVTGASAANRADVDHAVAPFNMDTCLDRNVELVNVRLAEIAQFVKTFLA